MDVSNRNLECKFLGKNIAMPFGISPTGTVGLTRYGGEIAVAKAARKMGVPCCVSTNAQQKWKKYSKKAGGNLWFQLYMWPDIDMRMRFVTGSKQLVLTPLL